MNQPNDTAPSLDPGHSAQYGIQDFKVIDVLLVLVKRIRLMLGVTVATAIFAGVVAYLLPDEYTGTARIAPPQPSQSMTSALLNNLAGFSGASAALGLKNQADIYAGMLKSRTVADALIMRFDLKALYREDTLVETREALRDVSRIKVEKDGIIVVEVDDRDPKRAADLANAYIQELDKLSQTIAVTEAGQRRVYLEKQLEQAKEKLSTAEVALRRTQEKTGLILLEQQGKSIIEAVARLRAEIASKEVQISAMRTFATEANPEYVRLRRELVGLRGELAKLEYSTANERGDILVPTSKVPEVGLEYVRRLRDVKYNETLFELLAKQYEIARSEEAKESGIVQVIDHAQAPDKSAKPKRLLIVLIAAFAGLVVAIVIAFAVEAQSLASRDPAQQQKWNTLQQYVRRS